MTASETGGEQGRTSQSDKAGNEHYTVVVSVQFLADLVDVSGFSGLR